MNKKSPLLTAGLLVTLTGCTLAPQYHRPEVGGVTPPACPEGAAYQAAPVATNAPSVPDIGWREFFTDERLQQVIALAVTNNRDLRIAALNVERARALYNIQRGELLPSVGAAGTGSKVSTPADLSSTGSRLTSERYDVNLGVTAWEIDFFGYIRNLKDRALEEYLATEQARRSAQIALVSSVASAYLTLAADLENLTLAETTLEAQQSSYGLIKRRNDLGLIPDIDVYRAQTQVDSALRDVARFTQRVALGENTLNLLVGCPIPSELLPITLADIHPPMDIVAGIPSDVLLRRPDVLQAEGMLKAANADIGAARAALFPRISLTATYGIASAELSDLFKGGQNTWSFAPRVTMPIFDTRIWAALRATKVQRKIVLAQYEKAIQSSFREVADALAVRGSVDREVSAQVSLVHAVSETHRLSNSRYDKGIDSYLSVLDSQRNLYATQQALVYLNLEKVVNQVRLYAVLGGGWKMSPAQATCAEEKR